MKTFTKVIALMAFWLAIVPALAGAAVMTLWNIVMPATIGAAYISYWQAIVLFVLGGLLSGGFGVALLIIAGSVHTLFHHGNHRMMRRHIHRRWRNMNDEQRREFMERMTNRFGNHD